MSKATILCVDDEVVILDSLEIQLQNAFKDEYAYEMAESADEALEIIEELEEEDAEIIVIVSDWLMPGMKGDEFLIKIHEKFPNVIKILLTGQADEEAIQRVKKGANLHRYLSKPWDAEGLIEAIKTGLEK